MSQEVLVMKSASAARAPNYSAPNDATSTGQPANKFWASSRLSLRSWTLLEGTYSLSWSPCNQCVNSAMNISGWACSAEEFLNILFRAQHTKNFFRCMSRENVEHYIFFSSICPKPIQNQCRTVQISPKSAPKAHNFDQLQQSIISPRTNTPSCHCSAWNFSRST